MSAVTPLEVEIWGNVNAGIIVQPVTEITERVAAHTLDTGFDDVVLFPRKEAVIGDVVFG